MTLYNVVRVTYIFDYNILDHDSFHYMGLLYTGYTLDYALSFYRRTINFVLYYYYYKFEGYDTILGFNPRQNINL